MSSPPRPATPLFPVRSIGLQRRPFEDLYHSLIIRPWWQFFAMLVVSFLSVNLFFAGLYSAQPGCVSNASESRFLDLFFFSVHTLATIGYGSMVPTTTYAHAVVTVEALMGLVGTALVTGLTFAKFSRPTSRVRFGAKVAAASRFGVPHLQFRMANERSNLVLEAQLRAYLLVVEVSPEGETMRRPVDLKLVRERTALFALSWTALHAIDENSPFYGPDAVERLRSQQARIYLTFTGTDETFSQTIHARCQYELDDIAWGHRHADILTVGPDGQRIIDYRLFDVVVPESAREGGVLRS